MSTDEKLRNSLHPGHKLHWYQIEKVLGQGGFGITYLAYDTNLDQHVAIKEYLPMELAVREGDFSVYPASQAQDSRYKWGLDRFLTEARTLARFKHPAIVRVLSVFEANNTAYMVMEYQQGSSLQQLLDRRRTIPEAELVAMVIPLLDGLETIHSQGFIHRDIKPSNLFIHDNGHPVLLDFGSARQALGEETRTLTSVVSPGYAPFEQYYSKSDRQGPWTDIYGLGATLYRCLTGLQPMAAIDRSEAILRSERDVFVSATEIGAGQYSASFLAAVDCALLFNETKRPQSIAEWRPYFDFSRSTEHAVREALHTTYPDDARTRFSALIDPPNVAATAITNPDARPRQDSDSGVAQSRGTTLRERARPSGLIESKMEPDAYSRDSEASVAATEAERQPGAESTAVEPAAEDRKRPWLAIAMALVLVAGGGIALAFYAGLMPSDLLGGASASRLITQGDRALAAGRVLEPAQSSALSFYLRAYQASPGNIDAEHGLNLAGERLAEEIAEAVAADDLARAEALAAHIDAFPSGIYDFAEVSKMLADARARADANRKKDQRVNEFIAAARADIERGSYVGNGTDNALARYRAVQILDPDNSDAAQGLSKLAVLLSDLGQAALAADDIDTARQWHGQASLIDANAPAVAALGTALNEAKGAAAAVAEQQSKLRELLELAADDFSANRLTTPAGRNALERYREVAQLDPENAQAAEGIRKIHDRYVVMSTQALTKGEFAQAGQLAARALTIDEQSEPARALQREIAIARERADEAESQRLAAEAEARAAQAAAARAAEERARVAAIEARRRQEEEQARRLLEQAEARAEAERQARLAEQQAAEAIEFGKPRIVVDFMGFHPKYARDGLTRDDIFKRVAPLLRAAGYEIVTRGQIHDAQYQWTNVKLLAFRLNVNENTATGLYSYVGSLNLLENASLRVSLSEALESRPDWTRSKNGMGPPTDLGRLGDEFVEMTRAFTDKLPGRR